jgi:hypothetical protein
MWTGLRRLPRTTATTSAAVTTTTTQRCYSPSLTEARSNEAGRGGRMSESGIKVAVFGGNGLVGRQLAAHLGTSLF